MSITPTRLYVEAQNGTQALKKAAAHRVAIMRRDGEAGFEIPASLIIMVVLIAAALLFGNAITSFVQQAIGKLHLP